MDEAIYEDIFTCSENICDTNELYQKRRLALAGTIGSTALIISNISLQTDVNLGLFMSGTVVFPSLIEYLANIQTQINIKHKIKNRK